MSNPEATPGERPQAESLAMMREFTGKLDKITGDEVKEVLKRLTARELIVLTYLGEMAGKQAKKHN